MIITDQTKDVIVVGEDQSKKATISANKMAKLQYLLTKGLYKDPITAVIAEWTNNGIDGVVQAGKNPIENPVIVSFSRNDLNQYVFSVEDKGIGLDKDDFENICMSYLESTKEDDNETIGHFGIGMKSFLSLERPATFTCRKNGMERKYLVYEGGEFVNYQLVSENPTTEGSGVKAELILKDWGEVSTFLDKAKQKLAYYDTAVIVHMGNVIDNKIQRHELFQMSSLCTNQSMHICLKDVYYSIDWEALGIKSINFPVALRFNLKDGIIPTPSRESYITNDATKILILNRIQEVSEYFVDKYNSTVKEFDKFIDGMAYYDNTDYHVSIGDKNLLINPLVGHSRKFIQEPKVKGVTFRAPKYYHARRYNFADYYTIKGYFDGRKFRSDKLSYFSITSFLFRKEKIVIIDEPIVGNIREYLKQKYSSHTLFIKKLADRPKQDDRGLGLFNSYETLLDLKAYSKQDQDKFIKEWDFIEKSLFDACIHETDIENKPEYIKWLSDKKEKQRLDRLAGRVSGIYNGLNKKDGDVTLAYSYKSIRGISFKKSVHKIDDLDKNKYLTVLIPDKTDKMEDIKGIIEMMPESVKTRFAVVGAREITKIPNSTKFINFKEFMTRDCKPFMRLASAILYNNILKDFRKIYGKGGIFQNCIIGVQSSKLALEMYVNNNLEPNTSDTVSGYILDVARDKNLFDKVIWDDYLNVKNAIEKYDFVPCLEEPKSWEYDKQKRYEKVINQLLLFRLKYYNDLAGASIVFKKEDELQKAV